MAPEKKVEVTMVRSMIGCTERQRRTLRALGLRKISAQRVHSINPAIKGLIEKVSHLVTVREL
jgi:large subunit ribosomal protein L30